MAAEEALLKRVLPHSIEAEQSVVGCMMVSREAITIAADILTEDDFYNRQYGLVFSTIVELNDAGNSVDAVTLQNKLKEKDAPPGGEQPGICERSDALCDDDGSYRRLCPNRFGESNASQIDQSQ